MAVARGKCFSLCEGCCRGSKNLMLVSDGVLDHGFQTVVPPPCQNLNPEKEFPISSLEIGDFPFHLYRKYQDFFLLLVVDPGSHLVASLLGFSWLCSKGAGRRVLLCSGSCG